MAETYQIKTRKHRKLKRGLKITIIIILLIFLIILLVGGFVAYKVYQMAKDIKLSKNDLAIKYENSIVKDINGDVIAILNGNENRESISISDMSEYLPAAFVAIEDERFYEHKRN